MILVVIGFAGGR